MREPLNQPNPKHRYVNNMFDRIAKRYDLMNTLMTAGLHRRWRRKAIELAAPPKGGLSLDVGCGTGYFTYHAAKKGANILGIDYAEEGINIAKKKYKHKNLKFEKLDVKNVKEKFDIIVSIGVMEHMDDP